ncbi:LysE/ArgO family amino acid transporter [Cellulomonas cellasea]|uniref:Amino acid transporter n=2 Tax=Cellulomonas cellasea TaxID=43670 RepID=A0A0A0BCP0_9CELL|nr:LysE/ArgO family amino acid transporter [Cellulomonas cellasea]KGM03654.1 amino acid transporter [Cellulomonas cellasea DSM 20118]GEA88427.1 amino acid transporter [Cellulomonas cellasea]
MNASAPADALVGLVTGLGLIVAIGAQNAFVLRQGLRREHVLGVVLMCALADAALVTAGVAGLGPVLTAHETVMAVVRYGGAAFLGWFAFSAARRALRPAALQPAADDAPGGRTRVLLTCAALTFLNPHVYLDTVVLLGSVAHQQDRPWAFAAGAVTASFGWFTTLGFGAGRLAPLFARPRAWQVLDALVALVMAALAVSLVVGT